VRRPIVIVVAVLLTAASCSSSELPEALQPLPVEPPVATTFTPPACTDQDGDDPTRSFAPDPGAPTPTVDAIRSRGRLIVGVSADTLLFGSRNPIAEGTPIEGFDIDMLREVAAAIFEVTVAQVDADGLIEYRVITYPERLPKIIAGPDRGGVDMVAHTMTITCERWEAIAFSTEYFDAATKVLSTRAIGATGFDELVVLRARMCVPAGGTNETFARRFEADGLVVTAAEDITDCLVGMQQGRFDAAIADDTVLAGFAAQDPNLVLLSDRLTEEPYGIGMRRDSIDLVRFVNAVLDEMRADGRWAAIYDRWLVQSGAVAAADIPAPPPAVYGREG
jgi:polar amino acid transport system substrate-binding protein